jgi:hypothetical protein
MEKMGKQSAEDFQNKGCSVALQQDPCHSHNPESREQQRKKFLLNLIRAISEKPNFLIMANFLASGFSFINLLKKVAYYLGRFSLPNWGCKN